MRLQESGEMYIESLYVLSKQRKFVRAIDIGEYMGYSKHSVSRALGLLKSGGLCPALVNFRFPGLMLSNS